MKFFDKELGIKVKLPRHKANHMHRLRITYEYRNDKGHNFSVRNMFPISEKELAKLEALKIAMKNHSIKQVYDAIQVDMPEELTTQSLRI